MQQPLSLSQSQLLQLQPINLDSLYEAKHNRSLLQLKSYQSILLKAHDQIRRTAQDCKAMPCCWFVVPSYVLGLSKYEYGDCVAYVVRALVDNGFQVRYYHPNMLFICWNHVVPKYARDELRRSQGIEVDQFGNICTDVGADTAANSNNHNGNNRTNSGNNNNSGSNNVNNNNNVNNSNSNNNAKPVDTYKPSGKLLYNAKMFSQLAERIHKERNKWRKQGTKQGTKGTKQVR